MLHKKKEVVSDRYFHPSLKETGNRIVSKNQTNTIFLDKNEQPEDIDNDIKRKILDDLYHKEWNRYPPADYSEIEKSVAQYCGLPQNTITVAPGSAYLITVLLNYFAINRKHLIIVQPSYSLFLYHCHTYNIPFDPWYLNKDLEFDINTLPDLTENSVLILASPNNPVGNTIKISELELLLSHPAKPLVVVDAVYIEYSPFNLNALILRYDNLIVLRSLSKAFPAAGIRLGYMCANEQVILAVRKLVLLFSINHFTLVYARLVLNNAVMLSEMKNRVFKIMNERDKLYSKLSELAISHHIYPKKSEGNFLLIVIPDSSKFSSVMNTLTMKGIKVLDTSATKMLENSFRVSIGTARENDVFFDCIKHS